MLASRRVARLQRRRAASASAKAETASIAAGYVRVSTEEQAAHGFGLEAQERAIRAFAESQGYELVTLIADPGVSGAVRPADRPGFAKLYEMAAASAFSILLVWKFDRLARQIVFAVNAVAELGARGVALRSVTEPIDTATPMGRTIFAVLAGMAEQEREAITERTWHGRKEKGLRGGHACGATAFGYDVDADGRLIVNEREARIVRRIFKMRADGATLQRIADLLNGDGVKTKRSKQWAPRSVLYILDNPIYSGAAEYLFRRFGAEQHVLRDGAHQAIIASS